MWNLTPNHVADGSDKEIRASFLHATTVGVEIDVAHWGPGSQSAHVDFLAVGMDDVNQIGVGRIQSNSRVVIFKQRTSRIESCETFPVDFESLLSNVFKTNQ